jgi:hypothetical protein
MVTKATANGGAATHRFEIQEVVAMGQFSTLHESRQIRGFYIKETNRLALNIPGESLPKSVLFPRGETDTSLAIFEWDVPDCDVQVVRERLRTSIYPDVSKSFDDESELIGWNIAIWHLHRMRSMSIVQVLTQTEDGFRLYSIVGSFSTIKEDLIETAIDLPCVSEIVGYFEIAGNSGQAGRSTGSRLLQVSGCSLRFKVPAELLVECRQWDTEAVLLPDREDNFRFDEDNPRRLEISSPGALSTLFAYRKDHEVVVVERVNRKTKERKTRVFGGLCSAYVVLLELFSDGCLNSGSADRDLVEYDSLGATASIETDASRIEFSFNRFGVVQKFVVEGNQTFAEVGSGSQEFRPITPLSFICALLGFVYE